MICNWDQINTIMFCFVFFRDLVNANDYCNLRQSLIWSELVNGRLFLAHRRMSTVDVFDEDTVYLVYRDFKRLQVS